MSEQYQNFAQTLAELISNKWTELDKKGRENIFFAGYELLPEQKFQTHGKQMLIEVYGISGDALPQSLKHTRMRDLYKIDLWVQAQDTSEDERIKLENDRAKVIDTILKIIHDNQTGVTGLKIATLTRWQRLDELDAVPIILHNSIFITGEWFHTKS